MGYKSCLIRVIAAEVQNEYQTRLYFYKKLTEITSDLEFSKKYYYPFGNIVRSRSHLLFTILSFSFIFPVSAPKQLAFTLLNWLDFCWNCGHTSNSWVNFISVLMRKGYMVIGVFIKLCKLSEIILIVSYFCRSYLSIMNDV